MAAFRRHWQSIDQKLPMLASGFVLVTVLVLGSLAYVLLERALVDSARRRMLSSATAVARLIQRPMPTFADSASRRADRLLLRYLKGRGSADSARDALFRRHAPGDTAKIHAALYDVGGAEILGVRRPGVVDPQWARTAILRQELTGDTGSTGPIENVGGIAAFSIVHPIRDPVGAAGPIRGYVVETRRSASNRLTSQLGVVADAADLQMLLGQDDVWTDFRSVTGPPAPVVLDSAVVLESGVGAFAPIPGSSWMVWLAQPMRSVLAPARTLLWSVLPLGIAIALAGALIMWRIARRITFPIVELTAAAETVAREPHALSDTANAADVKRGDEVARLRHAFGRMAERVVERTTLEQQLRHAQKMEAVGRLAGGIAHDFNNLLTAIRSYADLMLDEIPPTDSKHADVQEIRNAADRASALTAQLLAFSRKSMLQPRILDTRAVLTEVQSMLRRLVAEDIELVVDVPIGLWPVFADRGQLEQVIVNLAVNARDAMPNGGALRIAAVNDIVLDPLATRHGAVAPGEYVAIRVMDTGCGMDVPTQTRVFEPFFTTKEVGRGTGLGLATVHGIVAQTGGHVTFESAPAEGTTFTVYLPRALGTPEVRTNGTSAAHRGHGETILLVEDERAVRALARRVLVKAGFQVIESITPTDAIRLAREHASEIQLVLTDVVMPEMNGPMLVSHLASICPRARVLYISGYTDDEVIERGLANPGLLLLQKPFSAQQLVARVRSALDQVPV